VNSPAASIDAAFVVSLAFPPLATAAMLMAMVMVMVAMAVNAVA